MDRILFKCPLCCEESFDSPESLNNHILDILNRTLDCPLCEETVPNLDVYLQHLRDCEIPVSTDSEDYPSIDSSNEENVEAEEGRESKENDKALDENGYYCEICDVQFRDMKNHLKEYHMGEQVIVESEQLDEILEESYSENEGDEPMSVVYIEQDESDEERAPLKKKVKKSENEPSEKNKDVNSVAVKKEVLDSPPALEKKAVLNSTATETKVVRKPYAIRSKPVEDPPVKDSTVAGNQPVKDSTVAGNPPPLESTSVVESKAVRNPPAVESKASAESKAAPKDNLVKEQPALEIISFGKAADGTDEELSLTAYRCKNCNVRFIHLRLYKAHECNSQKDTICDICTIFFSSKSLLSQHRKKYHSKEYPEVVKKKHPCDICNIEFTSKKTMLLHRKMHAPKKNDQAIDEPVSYNSSGELITDEEVEKFVCAVCGKEFNKKYEEVHIKSHLEDAYDCSLCNKGFPTKNDLTLHLQAHANDVEEKISCYHCKKIFQHKDDLDSHITNECQNRKFKCNYCGKRFTKAHEQVKHERIHTGQKPYECKVCGKKFRVSYCLTIHMRTHSGIRPYSCETCGKRFKSHSAFRHHTLIHSDNRSYPCPYCNKAFKTAVQLAGHKNSHTKPFSCYICNRPFASMYAVKMHAKKHESQDELSYKCELCGAEYSRNIALRDHYIAHHDYKVEEIENFEKKLPSWQIPKAARKVREELLEEGEIPKKTRIKYKS